MVINCLVKASRLIRVVQMLLGHATLKSTEIYTHLTKPMCDDLRNRLNNMFSDMFTEGGMDLLGYEPSCPVVVLVMVVSNSPALFEP